MSIKDLLRRAKALISEPGKWTQNADGRTVAGKEVHPKDYNAVCWCIVGAIDRVSTSLSDKDKAVWAFLHVSLPYHEPRTLNQSHISLWNDVKERTHDEVMKAFDEAIEKCDSLSWGEGRNGSSTEGSYK